MIRKKKFIIGVDLGGTKISAGALSEDGTHTTGMRSVATQPELGAEGLVDRLGGVIEGVILDPINDEELYHGSSDVAGEIGHTTIDVNGRLCKCGNYGCREAYASGPAIATRAREALVREDAASLLPSLVDGQLERITAEIVYTAAKKCDGLANEIVRDTARYLGAGVATLL